MSQYFKYLLIPTALLAQGAVTPINEPYSVVSNYLIFAKEKPPIAVHKFRDGSRVCYIAVAGYGLGNLTMSCLKD